MPPTRERNPDPPAAPKTGIVYLSYGSVGLVSLVLGGAGFVRVASTGAPTVRPARVAARVALAVAVTLCIVVAGCPNVALARQAGPGDDGVGPSSLARLETVPPIEGVRISLDGAVVVTGPDGSALAAVAERRDVATRVEVLDERVAISEDTRARFSRIFGGGGDSVRIAYDVDYRVRLNFADDSGALIPPGDITRVRLKSTLGEVRDIDTDDVPWLQGTRVVSSRSGPEGARHPVVDRGRRRRRVVGGAPGVVPVPASRAP